MSAHDPSQPPPDAVDVDVDDDEEVFHCYRHPKVETALRCLSCERPICVDCAVTAAVGIKCRDCGRMPREARAAVPVDRLARAIVAGVVGGAVVGYVYAMVRGGFFSLIIAALLGIAVAEVVRRASGGYRDGTIARVAAASAALGIAWPLVLEVLVHGPRVLQGPGGVFWLVAVAVAGVVAHNRVS